MTYNILIVENDELTVLDLKTNLSDLGYHVVGAAGDYKVAIQIAKAETIDLAIVDISIDGEEDGIILAQTLYSKHNIPVIFLTSHQDNVMLQNARIANPLGYLLKPFRKDDLRTSIELAMHMGASRSRLKQSASRLMGALNRVEDAVAILTNEGIVEEVNPEFSKLMKDTEQSVVGTSLSKIIDISREEAKAWMLKTSQDNTEESGYRILEKSSGLEGLQAQIYALNDEHAKPMGYVLRLIPIVEEDDEVIETKVNTFGLLPQSLFVKDKSSLVQVPITNILYLEALGNYVKIVVSNKSFTTHSSIKALEAMLPNDVFFKVHRSYVVNLSMIGSIHNSHVQIGEKLLPLSRSGREELMSRINTL